MYTFVKQRDPKNEFDFSNVEFNVNSLTASDLAQEFYFFMLASGYTPGTVTDAFETVLEQWAKPASEEEN